MGAKKERKKGAHEFSMIVNTRVLGICFSRNIFDKNQNTSEVAQVDECS